jgi:hypothetical protein
MDSSSNQHPTFCAACSARNDGSAKAQATKLSPIFLSRWMCLAVSLTCLWLLAGCKTSTPSPRLSDSLAYVEVTGRTPLEVAHAVSEVFREASYSPARLPANDDMRLMFEKETGKGDLVLFGDWSGKNLWHRVRINIKPLDAQRQLVECDVYRVLDRGDPRFEEESKLSTLKKKPYQEILDKVKARLNTTQTAAPASSQDHQPK